MFTTFSCDGVESNCESTVYVNDAEADRLGLLHNDFMINLDQFEARTLSDSKGMSSRIGTVADFHFKFVNQYDDARLDKNEMKSYITETSHYMDHAYLYEQMFVSNNFSDLNINLREAYRILLDKGLINQSELALIDELHDMVKANGDGDVSTDEFKEFIYAKREEWRKLGFDPCSNEGYVSAAILGIGQHSVDYWTNYNFDGTKAVPAWLAADVGGALVGAVVGAVNGASGRSLGTGIVAGAIVGSTGLAGRVGRFLFG